MQPLNEAPHPISARSHAGQTFHLVESRRRALEILRSAVRAGGGSPVLLTGEPGAGKTALVQHFAAEEPARRRMATVDLAAGLDALEFLRLVGHALGVSTTNRLGKARLRLKRALANEAEDGRHWLLVLDQAHRGRSGIWDEVHSIANQVGKAHGFAALLLVGDTDLARSLACRRSSIGLASQGSTHIHLKPLDLDEARDLLDSADIGDVGDWEMLEELHRRSNGNPARLLRFAQTWFERHRGLPLPGSHHFSRLSSPELGRYPGPMPAQPAYLADEAQPEYFGEVVKQQSVSTGRAEARPAPPQPPALIPSRAPIRDEDGLVEVGWEGDLEHELSTPERASNGPSSLIASQSPLDEELIDDPYALLRSQSEAARNEAWLTSGTPEHALQGSEHRPQSDRSPEASPGLTREYASGTQPAGIRAEGQHEFAPYSQLFSRFRQSK